MRDDDKVIDKKKLRDSLDAEVKRVSDLFRFILKYKEHFMPSGVEFSGLRQYLPSDDAGRIDWKISAGKSDLYVKQYDEEQDMDVFIILDTSETMLFGTSDKLKSEYSAVVAAAIAYASVDAGINVGFGIYPSGVFVTPDGGMNQYNKVLYEVTDFENYGGTFDLEEALGDVIGQIQDNTTVFVVSDFLDTEGKWQSNMRLCSNKFRHVMCVMVKDLRDYKLPAAGNMRFESPDGQSEKVVNTSSIREAYNEEAQKQEEKVKGDVLGSGAGFLKIDTRDKFSAAFADYFESEERQW